MNKLFKDREYSAQKLLEVLPVGNINNENWIILSASTGGYVIAQELAKKINAPVDMIFTEKINAPHNNQCEIAIITETEELVIHEELQQSFNLGLDNIFQHSKTILKDNISYKCNYFRDGNKIIDMKNKNVIIVDEGLNTGLTMMACIKTVINLKVNSVCVAVPILPESIVTDIEAIADDLYYVQSIPHFVSIDYYYDDLRDYSLEDIKTLKQGNKYVT